MSVEDLQKKEVSGSKLSEYPIEIPGIDIDDVRKRTKLKWSDFKIYLMIFAETNASKLKEIKDAINADDINCVRKLLHALEGSALNIGANHLAISSTALGNAVKSGEKQIEHLISKLEDEFFLVQESILALNISLYETNNVNQIKETEINILDLKKMLINLLKLIEGYNIKSIKLVDEVIPYLIGLNVNPDEIKELKKLVLIFDFNNAQLKLKKIAESINVFVEEE
ncbi:MAG: Hpt domain-containing protein [Candidatus Omnitrophota bacterium]